MTDLFPVTITISAWADLCWLVAAGVVGLLIGDAIAHVTKLLARWWYARLSRARKARP